MFGAPHLYLFVSSKYFDELNEIWDKVELNTFNAKDIMDEYDKNFRLCLDQEEDMIYDTILYFLHTKAKTCTNMELYQKNVTVLDRISSYLNRFWVHNNNKTKISTAALNIWKIFHP